MSQEMPLSLISAVYTRRPWMKVPGPAQLFEGKLEINYPMKSGLDIVIKNDI
jgi:hypothetical protein